MGGAEECRTDTGYSENILQVQVCIHLSTLKDTEIQIVTKYK